MKFLLLGFLFLTACQSSKSVASAQAKTADYFLSQGFKQVTFIGENDSPRFSETGNEIIFIGRDRPAHKGAQVYEVDLRKNRERRVTFHDGEDISPSYVSGRDILYCSSTDEIKESPFLNKNPDKDYPPTELYISDIYGNSIQRMTHYPGYDGEAVYVKAAKPFVIFVSRRGSLIGIYKLDLKSKQVSFLAVEKDKDNRSPTVSSDGKHLAWIQKDVKSGKESLQVMGLNGKKAETVKENGGHYRDLFWQPDSQRLFYSVQRPGDSRFQLEVYDIEKKCTQSLFKGKDSLIQPVVSDEKKPKIAFVRVFQDKKQIYMVDLPDNLGPCLEAPPPPKMGK